MRISYNKLWKMLIDKEMNKNDLKDAAGISAASVAKLGKGANITTDVLLKICEALDCKLEDIMETIIEQKVLQMSKIITLNAESKSIQHLCKKDKRLAKVNRRSTI